MGDEKRGIASFAAVYPGTFVVKKTGTDVVLRM